jgi:putative membrane protein
MKYPQPDNALAKKMTTASVAISVLVLILVGVMRQVKIDLGIDFSFLPPYHALFNTIVAISLISALWFIKQKDIENHRRSIYSAMIFSALFLICYVLYHFTTVETTYCKYDWTRGVYFVLLISHIVLAGLSLPFILITFTRGFTFQVDKHKALARYIYPVWLYVAITGPICYLMLKPCY